MQYASENLIPVSLELGGKSPNVFFGDVMAHRDEFLDKALEGFTMFALNQGEVCTCPSQALIQASIYGQFMEMALDRTRRVKQGNPLALDTMIGAQASNDQLEKILSYVDIGVPAVPAPPAGAGESSLPQAANAATNAINPTKQRSSLSALQRPFQPTPKNPISRAARRRPVPKREMGLHIVRWARQAEQPPPLVAGIRRPPSPRLGRRRIPQWTSGTQY